MKIALDAMGGDHAPRETVQGALDAAREYGVAVFLVGDEAAVRAELSDEAGSLPVTVVHAPEVIGMDEHPATAVRRKKGSSLVAAMRLVRDGQADAYVSAGNSGAVMAAALFVLGRCESVDRPAIGSPLPTPSGTTLLIDAGANTDPRPEHLLQFGRMGSVYMSALRQIDRPTVALLSNGEEESKGNALTLATHELLCASDLNFTGNIEGRDVLRGTVDVVVTDGFTGNVALKSFEGVAEMITSLLRQEVTRGLTDKLGALILRSAFRRVARRLDYAEVGGAPLLGVNGNVFISHGRSKAKAIKNALRVASEVAALNVPEMISRGASSTRA